MPYDLNCRKVEDGEADGLTVGDEVWVKPAVPSCTRQWSLGKLTGIVSKHVVCVDGMPRHVRDVRRRRYAGQGLVLAGGESTVGELSSSPCQEGEDPAESRTPHGLIESGLVDTETDVSEIAEADGPDEGRGPEAGPAEEGETEAPWRSLRRRTPPVWMVDYVP